MGIFNAAFMKPRVIHASRSGSDAAFFRTLLHVQCSHNNSRNHAIRKLILILNYRIDSAEGDVFLIKAFNQEIVLETRFPICLPRKLMRNEKTISLSGGTWYASSTSVFQLSIPPTPRIAPQTVTTVRQGSGSSYAWQASLSCWGV